VFGFLVLLAGLYVLPDGCPEPDAAQRARIENALATLRAVEGEGVDAAVRDLALVGDAAVPFVVARLNEAPAEERLLLLAAVRRTPKGAALLAQARQDPHAAVRAWAIGPPPPPPPDLRLLAGRYLELLALAEVKLRDEADEDLARLKPPASGSSTAPDGRGEGCGEGCGEDDEGEGAGPRGGEGPAVPARRKGPTVLGRPRSTLDAMRARMEDAALSRAILKERADVALRFAIAGGQALRSGALAPDLQDPVFLAYVGLLREETASFYYALRSLVALKEKAVPVFEALLARPNHDARKIVRILCAVRPDGGRGLYASLASHRPEVQRALVVVAPDVLAGEELVARLEEAALAQDSTVRSAALDALLELPAPAGLAPARVLLDPTAYGPAEFGRAAELLARAGERGVLAEYASVSVPPEQTEAAQQLRSVSAACQGALRHTSGPDVEALGARFLESPSRTVRTLGIDLLRDREALLAHARREPDENLAKAAVYRALRLHGATAAEEALQVLQARGIPVQTPVVRELLDGGRVDLVVGLAVAGDERARRTALGALADLPALDAQYEAALLAAEADAPAPLRSAALGALVALGTPAARQRLLDAGETALSVLAARALPGGMIPFDFPLRPFLAGADADRLQTLGLLAEAVPAPEPGLFRDLMAAWDGIDLGEGVGAGVTLEKQKLLEGLARSSDATSAQALFDDLVAARLLDPALVMGVLKAAARHLPAEQLARLLPLLESQVAAERPDAERRPPPYSVYRHHMLLGGINALGYRQVEAALPFLCDCLLDPTLTKPAYDWKGWSGVPYWAREALRDFPATQVEPAFRAALARAEADGRLARMDPAELFDQARWGRTFGRDRGRRLDEVSLALAQVLERLPFEGEVAYERMVALGGLSRYAEAAAAAREDAARKRACGWTEFDGFWTPERAEQRAGLYEALAAGDAAAVAAVAEASDEPYVTNLAAWYLRFNTPDLPRAAAAGEKAVRASAGLQHDFRDTLAAVRVAQGDPDAALRLLDPRQLLPVKRNVTSRWYLVFAAQAHLLRGDRLLARYALETAADQDRRILPSVRRDPAFQDPEFQEIFRRADEDFFFRLFPQADED